MNNTTVFNNPEFGQMFAGRWNFLIRGKAVSRLNEDESTRIEIDHPQSPGEKLELLEELMEKLNVSTYGG